MVWYTTQSFNIQCGKNVSQTFNITYSSSQGDVLSPHLFNIYMDELYVKLNTLNIGCNVNCTSINHLFYADDSVLLALSPSGLQCLLHMCLEFANCKEIL